MVNREIKTKFKTNLTDLIDVLTNQKKLSELNFTKFKFLKIKELTTANGTKTFTRRFILNKEALELPEFMMSKIKPEYLEWEEIVCFDLETNSGMFTIVPNLPVNYAQKFLCHGDFVFNSHENGFVERQVNVKLDIKVPWIVKSTFESIAMNQVWLLLHHEKEVINDYLETT